METITCPVCNAQVPAGAAYCDVCGSPLMSSLNQAMSASESSICPRCGNAVLPDAAFCGNCGAPLKDVPSLKPDSAPGFCPNCQAAIRAGDIYCDNCGHLLRSETDMPTPPPVEPLAPTSGPVEGAPAERPAPRLIIQPDGIMMTLAPGRDIYVIGREDPSSGSYPDVDLVPFGGEEGGVSRQHAQITRRGEAYFIEDLNSVNYTFVNKKKIAVGIDHPLQDGDEIRLGRVLMRFETGQ